MMWTHPQHPISGCRQSINKQAGVSLTLARYLSQNVAKPSENLIFSPVSINLLVSLIAAGASGDTLKELLSYLNSDSIDDVNRLSEVLVSFALADGSLPGGPKLSVANSIWVQQDLPLNPSFQRVVESTYKADAFQVNFVNTEEIVSQVNSWAEEKTNGLIKQAINSVDPRTKLMLANALYFKGEWDQKFDPSLTKDEDFHLLCGDSVKAPFMRTANERYINLFTDSVKAPSMRTGNKQYISVFDGFKVLRLPYKHCGDGRQFSMYIFLPDLNDGLPELVDKVGSEPDFLDQHLPCNKVEANICRIPKFKFSFGFEASKALKKLGVASAFEGGLTEMVESSENLSVSRFFHKALIEVNEQGTEAVSVSVAMMELVGLPPPPVDFVADHPFLFLIREDTTGALLFFGHVLNPLLE